MTRTINANIEAWRIIRGAFDVPQWVVQAFLVGDIHWRPEWRDDREGLGFSYRSEPTGQWIFAGPAVGRHSEALTEPSWLLRHSTGKLEVMSDKDLVARYGQ